MIKILSVFVLLTWTSPAWGQQVRIGLVNIQKAISQSKAGEEARKKFEAEIKRKEANLLKEKQRLERMRSDLDKKALLLKPEERMNVQRDFQKRVRDYERTMNDTQEELRQKETAMTAQILKELQQVVQEIGRNRRFTLIVDRTQLLYADKAIDITNDVIQLYNARFGGKMAKKR